MEIDLQTEPSGQAHYSSFPIWQRIDRLIGTVTAAISWLAVGAVFGLFGLIMANVIMRYVFNSPMVGAYDTVRFMMAGTVYLGLAYTLRQGAHISIKVLTERLPLIVRAKAMVAGHIANAFWIALLAWGGWRLWLQLLRTKQTSAGLVDIELWMVGLAIIIGLTWFAVEAVAELVRALLGVSQGVGK